MYSVIYILSDSLKRGICIVCTVIQYNVLCTVVMEVLILHSVIQMLYYGHNDISLGDFLKRYCFRPDYRCQTCGSEMTKHQRHIVHGSSSLHISVQQLDIPIPRSNDGIFTWLACKHCTLVRVYILIFSTIRYYSIHIYHVRVCVLLFGNIVLLYV